MSEHPPTPNLENYPTSPNEWDFVKDVSFSKDVTEYKIPGQEDDVEYDYAYYSDNKDKEPVWEYSHDQAPTKLKTAAELAMERHNVSPDASTGLVKEQILSKNEHKYDELRDRIYAIEQTYPDINGDPQSDEYKAIPDDVVKEWKLACEYTKLISQPVEDLDNFDDVKDAYGKITQTTDNGDKIINIVASGQAASAGATLDELTKLTKKNKSLVNSPEEERPIPNVDNLVAEWKDELSRIEGTAACRELLRKIDETMTPGRSPFGLRALTRLKEGIMGSYYEKYDQLQTKEKQEHLKEVQGEMRALSEKYKDHPDALGPADLDQLRKKRDKYVEDIDNIKLLISENVTHINDIEEYLAKLPKSKFMKRKKIERELEEEKSDLDFNAKWRDRTVKKYERVADHLHFLELVDEAKQLKSDLSSTSSK